MMQYSKSLFFSLLIHSALFASLFVIYEFINQKTEPVNEKRICINLKTIHSQTQTQHKQNSVTKVQKKEIHKDIKQTPHIKEKHIVQKLEKVETVKFPSVVDTLEIKNTDEHFIEEITQVETMEKIPQPIPKRECETYHEQNSYIDNNIEKIALLIQENLYYPRRARKKGIEGTVKVKFFLHKDATVSDVSVITSKSDILSRSAIKTIKDLSGTFPKPLNELTLTVPINYSLH